MNIRDDLLTIGELSEQLGVTRRTLERWHAQRIGPPRIKIGKQVYYRAASVREWMLAHEQSEVRSAGRAHACHE